MDLRRPGSRRPSFFPTFAAITAAATLAASCAPNEQAQTVSFVLDLDAGKVSRIEFDVTYSSGGFASTDGQCVVGSAAGPRSLAAAADKAVVHKVVQRKVRAASSPAAIGATGLDTTTSSTVTTTSMPTTTTTLASFDCTITMRVQGTTQSVGSLQWITGYADAPGDIAGTGDGVQCISPVSGALAAFNDDEATRSVSGGLVSLSGFSAPADVAVCTFTGTAVPQASDFTITLEEATGPDLVPLSPAPSVVVSGISCEGAPTTTTTQGPTTTMASTTTTTLAGGGQCGNGVINAGEQCDDHNTVSDDGCSATCQIEYDFTAVDDDAGRLTIRVLNGRGIPPGATLALCKFQGDIQDADLEVETVECGFPDGDDCDPGDDAEVTVSTTTTTTTTTTSTTKSTTTTTTTTTLASSSQAAAAR